MIREPEKTTPEQQGSLDRALQSLLGDVGLLHCRLTDLYGGVLSDAPSAAHNTDVDWALDLAEDARFHFDSGANEQFVEAVQSPRLPHAICARSIASTVLLVAWCPQGADLTVVDGAMKKRAQQIAWILDLVDGPEPEPDPDPGARSVALSTAVAMPAWHGRKNK